MLASAVQGPLAPSASAVAALAVDERRRDGPGVWIPRPEIHLVVRFGPSTRGGVDVHVLGVRPRVHRKLMRGGQRTVTARLRLGEHEAVLGAPASALAGRVVPLEDLWGDAAARRLFDRLGDARTTAGAAAALENALAARLAIARGHRACPPLVLEAAGRLAHAPVSRVAAGLRVSERHLRRVFREALGLGPKTFARLARFRRALDAAREDDGAGWASIAAAAGYYDQAHLIAEFRAISGATPQGLLAELRAAAVG
ncbi:MAG TPA: helix-turn-helix domain-containing protein [Myxococcales bacterium]|nr:helix-turn-helix domain-containing protein [Myxococcales bacterium]